MRRQKVECPGVEIEVFSRLALGGSDSPDVRGQVDQRLGLLVRSIASEVFVVKRAHYRDVPTDAVNDIRFRQCDEVSAS